MGLHFPTSSINSTCAAFQDLSKIITRKSTTAKDPVRQDPLWMTAAHATCMCRGSGHVVESSNDFKVSTAFSKWSTPNDRSQRMKKLLVQGLARPSRCKTQFAASAFLVICGSARAPHLKPRMASTASHIVGPQIVIILNIHVGCLKSQGPILRNCHRSCAIAS